MQSVLAERGAVRQERVSGWGMAMPRTVQRQHRGSPHPEWRAGGSDPGAALTFLIRAGVHEDKKPVLVDAAGVHGHGHGCRADVHIIGAELFFSSTELTVNNCLERIDSFWKKEEE